MTETPPKDVAGESPKTAAHDFADARFRINEVRRSVRDDELSRRHIRLALATLLPIGLAAIVTVNIIGTSGTLFRIDQAVLIGIDIAAGLIGTLSLYRGVRSIAKKTKNISKQRLRILQLREAERDAKARMPLGGSRLLWTYHSDVLTTIEEYREHALRYRRIHNRFQTLIIIGSLTTTAIATAAAKYPSIEWAAVVVSFTVGVSAGMTGYFKFRERSMNLQQAADDLEHEHKAVELGIRSYRRMNEEDRLVEFAQKAENIKDEQRKREQQLEQPPDARAAIASPSNTST